MRRRYLCPTFNPILEHEPWAIEQSQLRDKSFRFVTNKRSLGITKGAKARGELTWPGSWSMACGMGKYFFRWVGWVWTKHFSKKGVQKKEFLINKTKYFRLRLTDEVSSKRDLRETWDWPETALRQTWERLTCHRPGTDLRLTWDWPETDLWEKDED